MASRSLPPFLAVPLSSYPAFVEIDHALITREQQRHHCAAKVQAGVMGERKRLTTSRRAVEPSLGSAGGDYARFSMSNGLLDDNVRKNRYGDIIAFDKTRILLPPAPGQAAGEYVNASLVQEPDLGLPEDQYPRRWWVASQAPIASTLHAFISLLLSPPTTATHAAGNNAELPLINLLVQLTPLVEQGRQKCHPYFPKEVGETWNLPSAEVDGESVWVRLNEKVAGDGIRTSKLTVGKGGDEQGRKVVHVEYRGWGDHGIPSDVTHLVNFTKSMLSLNASLSPSPSNPSPILIGCSAGVGRTGTFMTIASLLPLVSGALPALSPLPPTPSDHPLGPYPSDKIEKLGVTPRDFVGLTIDGLREQRCTMVQTQKQVMFCFEALKEAWELENKA